jgi:hypothetical protein
MIGLISFGVPPRALNFSNEAVEPALSYSQVLCVGPSNAAMLGVPVTVIPAGTSTLIDPIVGVPPAPAEVLVTINVNAVVDP